MMKIDTIDFEDLRNTRLKRGKRNAIAKKQKLMRENRHPLPEALSGLKFKATRMLYEIKELDTTYAFPFEIIASLKLYFQIRRLVKNPIARWYSKLDTEEKKKVIIS